jgi:hypothetical protein
MRYAMRPLRGWSSIHMKKEWRMLGFMSFFRRMRHRTVRERDRSLWMTGLWSIRRRVWMVLHLHLHIKLHDGDDDVDMGVSCVLPSSASAADVCDVSRCFIVGCDADRICVLL